MKLVYFNGRGLAETSRLILAFNNVEYEDFRYPLKIIDWKTHNLLKEEFELDKQNNKLLDSLNKLPYLVDKDVIIPQSKSIERYLGYKYNMMGLNSIQAARIDSICEYIVDFKKMYQEVRKFEGLERETKMNEWFNETLKEKLKLLDNILGKENNNYCVGENTSLADIILYSFIRQFFDDKVSSLNACTDKIKNIIKNIENNDSIKNWLQNRPETSF